MPTDVQTTLRRSEFFRGISDRACRDLAETCRVKRLSRRDVLFLEGSTGDAMFLLMEGAIQLHKAGDEGRDIVIRTVKPGATFGEVVLFEQNRYPVTAVAVTASRVLGLTRRGILRLLDNREFRDDFIAMLMKRQRYLADRVRYLASYDVETRLLLFLRERYGEGDTILSDLPKKDIAAAIGVSPETLSRVIARMTRAEQLSWIARKVTVPSRVWEDLRMRV